MKNSLKKTNEELDNLHDIVIKNLYEVFEYEMDAYMEFYAASMQVLGFGNGTFPFCTRDDSIMGHLGKCLDIIEKNIATHMRCELEIIFKERSKSKSYVNQHSEALKKTFRDNISRSVKQMLAERSESLQDIEK